MTPEERAEEVCRSLDIRVIELSVVIDGERHVKTFDPVKTIAAYIRQAEQARDERAAKIAEKYGDDMYGREFDYVMDQAGHDIAAAIRAPDTTPSP